MFGIGAVPRIILVIVLTITLLRVTKTTEIILLNVWNYARLQLLIIIKVCTIKTVQMKKFFVHLFPVKD